MVCVGAFGAVTVIVAVLLAVPVCAAAVIRNEPLPLRFVGVIPDMVSHV